MNEKINEKIKNNFTFTQKELENTQKITDRERFVYIYTSLIFNPVIMGLPLQRRDEILKQMKEKFCPSVSNADWYVLFHSCENLRKQLVQYLAEITTAEEQQKIASDFTKLVGDHNYSSIARLAKKIQNLINKSKS